MFGMDSLATMATYNIQVFTSPMIRAIPSPEVSPMLTPNALAEYFYADLPQKIDMPLQNISQVPDEDLLQALMMAEIPTETAAGETGNFMGTVGFDSSIDPFLAAAGSLQDSDIPTFEDHLTQEGQQRHSQIPQLFIPDETDFGADFKPDGNVFGMQKQQQMLLVNQQLNIQSLAATTQQGDAMRTVGAPRGELQDLLDSMLNSTKEVMSENLGDGVGAGASLDVGSMGAMITQSIAPAADLDAFIADIERDTDEGLDAGVDGDFDMLVEDEDEFDHHNGPDVTLKVEVTAPNGEGKRTLCKCSFPGCDKLFTRAYNLKSGCPL
jgi:hypothetical protein